MADLERMEKIEAGFFRLTITSKPNLWISKLGFESLRPSPKNMREVGSDGMMSGPFGYI